jgi:hypothetical protein
MLKTPLASPVAGDATQDGTCLLPGDMDTPSLGRPELQTGLGAVESLLRGQRIYGS